MPDAHGFRVSPPKVFAEATRASRPPAGSAGALDAHRQAGFVLGAECDLVVDLLAAEARIAEAASGAKFRNQRVAATLVLWSRAWLCRLQALHAVEWGNYAAAMPLVRSAADYQASMLYILGGAGASEWDEWLAGGGIRLAPEHHATEFALHPFRAAEMLAAEPRLGAIYRAATDFAMPHFGASLLLAASESAPGKVAVTFGDRDFHLGLAEIVLGWLLELGSLTLEAVEADAGLPGDPAGRSPSLIAGAADITARSDRCCVVQVEVDGVQRYLVSNWRRTPGAAPKRMLL